MSGITAAETQAVRAAETVPSAVPIPRRATVLCVDDEPNILSALKRVLRGAEFMVLTAQSGALAVSVLQQTPVDMVISDMRMPGMDGAELLEQVHRRWPQVVRILLTGHADTASAVAAINRGQIFRYLQKPWHEPELLGAVREGLERLALQRETQRLQALTRQQNDALQTVNAELEARVQARTKDLQDINDKVKRNYLKSIKVFANMMELRGGLLAGHGRRVAECARDIARKLKLPDDDVLQVFVAGLLHDVGLIGIADKLLGKPVARYLPGELAQYREHPLMAEQSLLALEDMQPLLPIIRAHHERFDGLGFPDKLAGTAIPIGARILAVADAFDDLQNGHLATEPSRTYLPFSRCSAVTDDLQPATRREARALMRQGRGTQFDPDVLDAFLDITEPEKPTNASTALQTQQLEAGMQLARDLVSASGVMMLTRGHRLTPSLIQRIREFELREGSRLEVHTVPKGPA